MQRAIEATKTTALIFAAIAVVAGLLAAARTQGATTDLADRPNILWITVEDMSPNLGCYGDKYARTPHLDRLARQSVRYSRAFATAPVCSPARSCLITGVYATSLGTSNLRSRLPIPGFITGFPARLRGAGYYCSNNVKTDYNTSNEPAIIGASWDACSDRAHWRGRRPGQPFFAVFNDLTTHQSRTAVWPYTQFQAQVQARLSASERHDPATAPVPPYYPDTPIVRRTVARYYDCVSVMDQNVGKLLSELDADGLAGSTIVFFFSDHGAGLPRHKRLILDSGLHIPLLVRFTRKYQHLAPAGPGATVERLVSFVDFAPTVLSLAGLSIPTYLQGQPFLGPAAADARPREYVYGARDRVDEAYDCARCVRDANYLYVRTFMPHLSYNQPSYYSDQSAIRQEITKLAGAGKLSTAAQRHYTAPSRPIEELYHGSTDPHQVCNLAASDEHQEVLRRMRRELREWILETRDVGFVPEAQLSRFGSGTTPYDVARNPATYPLERILAAADLVGRGSSVGPQQVLLLKDPHAAVRYWAAVGLSALGTDAEPAAGTLREALADMSPPARIQAAGLLCSLGHSNESLAVLESALRGNDLNAALHAARTLELLGEKARPSLKAMREVFQTAQGRSGDAYLFMRFALESALKHLTE